MQQKTKYAILASVIWLVGVWFFAEAQGIGWGNGDTDAWVTFVLLILTAPVWAYWVCIWLWGKVPSPQIRKLPSVPQKYRRRLLHAVAAVTMVQIAQLLNLTNQVENHDIAVFLAGMINVIALAFGWGLSVMLVKRFTSHRHRKLLIATYIVTFLTAAILNAVSSDMSTEHAANQLQPDKAAQNISDMIWGNLSPEDRKALQMQGENKYSAAAEAFVRELEKEKRQKIYPGLMQHE